MLLSPLPSSASSSSGKGGSLRPLDLDTTLRAPQQYLKTRVYAEGVVDAAAFARLPRGAYFINMARGGHVVDEALLAALDSGHLAGAALDVFNVEPLPAGHPYWTHPKVHVTPHIAGATNPRTASPGVIENIKRLRAGRELIHRVDPKTGY